jgi:DNA-binding transcriptional LysR family regulator
MDLKHLQHLTLLAEELNFGRAAKRANLSQSAFTRSIQALEAELGLVLFDRGKRYVRVTATGRHTLERARGLLAGARDLARELEHLRTGDLGSVAVGAGPYSAATLLNPALAELHRRHPGVTTRVEINNWGVLHEHLKAERIDFFLGNVLDILHEPGISIQRIGSFHGMLCCRAGHPLAGRKSVSPADIGRHRIATVTLLPQIKTAFTAAFALPDQALPIVALECDNIEVLTSAALGTDLILGATHQSVRALLENGMLHPLRVAGLDQESAFFSELGLVRLAGRTLTPAGAVLCGLLLEAGMQTTPDAIHIAATRHAGVAPAPGGHIARVKRPGIVQ